MTIKYRPDIDGLRAISVLAVIFCPVIINIFNNRFLSCGFLGLDIFRIYPRTVFCYNYIKSRCVVNNKD